MTAFAYVYGLLQGPKT